MLKAILDLHRRSIEAVGKRCPVRKLLELPVRERISRMRYIAEKDLAQFDTIAKDIEEQLAGCLKESRTGEE